MAVSQPLKERVRERASGRCEYCHADERWQFIRFTIDHVVPSSSGGTDQFDNLALACRNCNERRSNRCEAADTESNKLAPLFNPRQDSWGEHFTWDADRIRILGVTAIGRATSELLDFNDDRHGGYVLRVRRRDLRDGYHPPPEDPVLATS